MKTKLLLVLLLLGLSACGFHLRGSQQTTRVAVAKVFVVNAGASEVSSELKAQLSGAGAGAVSSIDQASYIVRLEREYFDQTVLSVSAQTGKVEEYQLSLSVYMTLVDAAGKELVSAEEIRLERDYTFDEDAVLGKFEEEAVLRDELAVEAATQVLRRLNEVSSSR